MRPTILVFNKFYLPGFKAGGPIQSITNLAESLNKDFSFRVVARDRDSGDSVPYPDVWLDDWNSVGSAQVRYLDATRGRFGQIREILENTPHDILYLNSFFDFGTMLLPTLAALFRGRDRRPIVVAPRGEFSPGALKIKPARKRLFIAVAKLLGLHRQVHWHASAQSEAGEIAAVMGTNITIHTASNIPRPLPPTLPVHPSRTSGEPLRVMFLSRISPKKNLTFALDVLKTVAVPIRFSIVGYVDDATHWTECLEKIAGLPPNVEVKILDPVAAGEVPALLATQDLFFLPTLGENFGHAIIEALGAGTPVLISDRTPWRGLEAHGIGADLPLDQLHDFASWLKEQSEKNLDEAEAQRQRCFEFARRFAEHDDLIEASRSMFAEIIARAQADQPYDVRAKSRSAGVNP